MLSLSILKRNLSTKVEDEEYHKLHAHNFDCGFSINCCDCALFWKYYIIIILFNTVFSVVLPGPVHSPPDIQLIQVLSCIGYIGSDMLYI